MTAPRRAALAVALLAALLVPAGASAAPGLEIGFEDERILLDDPGKAPPVVREWARLGVDVVRIHARWWQIAPGRTSARRPRGFRPADHRDRRYTWGTLDNAIELVRSHGMRVMLTVTGPGPLWTSRSPGRRDPAYKPDPREYASFARAVATRYRGRIARYLLWNEPNIPGWLMPQNECRRGVCTPVSPHLYRGLVRAGIPALKAGDPGTPVLIGELAPIGEPLRSEGSIVAPLRFLRDMACVDHRYRRLRGRRCAGFRPAYGDGIGHHPHGKRSAPDRPSRNRDWAKLGDLRRLERVLDRLSRSGRLRRSGGGRFDIWLTEFGYQTSPPDHYSGITVRHQNEWLQQASYLAWRDPRVRSLTYYQWLDEPVRWRGLGSIAYAGWQSGLLYVTGEPKPAYEGFVAPLVVDRPRGGGSARVWGQVRPGGRHRVTIERRAGSGWRELASVDTDGAGLFARRLAVRDGDRLRMSWTDEGARSRSGSVHVSSRGPSRLRAAAADADLAPAR